MRLKQEKADCDRQGIIFREIDNCPRHWILSDTRALYVEFPDGYPFSAPVVTFATKDKDSTIERKLTNYLINWSATKSIANLAKVVFDHEEKETKQENENEQLIAKMDKIKDITRFKCNCDNNYKDWNYDKFHKVFGKGLFSPILYTDEILVKVLVRNALASRSAPSFYETTLSAMKTKAYYHCTDCSTPILKFGRSIRDSICFENAFGIPNGDFKIEKSMKRMGQFYVIDCENKESLKWCLKAIKDKNERPNLSVLVLIQKSKGDDKILDDARKWEKMIDDQSINNENKRDDDDVDVETGITGIGGIESENDIKALQIKREYVTQSAGGVLAYDYDHTKYFTRHGLEAPDCVASMLVPCMIDTVDAFQKLDSDLETATHAIFDQKIKFVNQNYHYPK